MEQPWDELNLDISLDDIEILEDAADSLAAIASMPQHFLRLGEIRGAMQVRQMWETLRLMAAHNERLRGPGLSVI